MPGSGWRPSVGPATGPFEAVPLYDPDRTLETVLTTHPEVRSARVAVERAQAAVRRTAVEPIPNLTLSTGYVDTLPKAEETYRRSLEVFEGGQFEYLRVIKAQQAVAEARLEYNRALGEAWRAVADRSACSKSGGPVRRP